MNKASEIERTIEEIRNMRLKYDLSHVIFAFPRVKTDLDEEWRAPSPFVAGCLAAAEKSNHPADKNLPYKVNGITQIEFQVTTPNIKRLMKIGVFTILRHKSGFRITLPPEIIGIRGRSTIAIADTPPFHRGATPNMDIILQLQKTCRQISEEPLPDDKWINLPKHRIKELKERGSIKRKDKEDTRLVLWIEQKKRCAACGNRIRLDGATLEHELPRAMHGPNIIRNLSVTCFRCNNEKGSTLPFGLTPDDPRWANYILSKGLIIPHAPNSIKDPNMKP